MNKKSILCAFAVVLVFSSITFMGCTPSERQTLTLYVGMLQDQAALAAREFERATGIETLFVRMSGGEILAQIRAEAGNPQASVWYGGGSLTFIEADRMGLLHHYISPYASAIPEHFRCLNGAWTGIYMGYLVFGADRDWLERNNVAMPATWECLLNPAFRGEIVIAHPSSSSTAYNILTTILQLKGEQPGWDFMRRLNENIRQYTRSGSAGGRMVQRREIPLTIGYLHDLIAFRRENSPHIIMAAPEDGTGFEIGAVGIIAGAPELGAAKRFVDWALSPAAQELGQRVNAFQFLTHPNARQPEEVRDIRVKLIDQDDEWAGANRTRILEIFNDIARGRDIF